jgi:hypothetical protein
MKSGEGEDAHRATFFDNLQELLEGTSQVLGVFPLTGLDKTLVTLNSIL